MSTTVLAALVIAGWAIDVLVAYVIIRAATRSALVQLAQQQTQMLAVMQAQLAVLNRLAPAAPAAPPKVDTGAVSAGAWDQLGGR